MLITISKIATTFYSPGEEPGDSPGELPILVIDGTLLPTSPGEIGFLLMPY